MASHVGVAGAGAAQGGSADALRDKADMARAEVVPAPSAPPAAPGATSAKVSANGHSRFSTGPLSVADVDAALHASRGARVAARRSLAQDARYAPPARPTWRREPFGLQYTGPACFDGDALPIPRGGYAAVDAELATVTGKFDRGGAAAAHDRPGPHAHHPEVQAKLQRLAGRQRAARRRALEALSNVDVVDAPEEGDVELHYRRKGFQKAPTPRRFEAVGPLVKQVGESVAQKLLVQLTARGPPLYRRPRPSIAELNVGFDVQRQQRVQPQVLSGHRERRLAFVAAVASHANDFRDYHRAASARRARVCKAVLGKVEERQADKDKEAARLERERLRALKNDDMDAYNSLLEKTKNDRVEYLLQQTGAFLEQMGDLVEQQRVDDPGAVRRRSSGGSGAGARAYGGAGGAKAPTSPGGRPDGEAAADPTSSDYYARAHRIREVVHRQPAMLKGGALKAYQLAGLEWMVSLYNNNLNGILADEMGLGKTIQTIALLAHLMEVKMDNGPFLVVVPLATLANWAAEFEKWAPEIVVVTYKGIPQARKLLQRTQMVPGTYNCLLTTPEYIMRDKSVLKKVEWNYIIIDEGHRMKNAHCKFSLTLGQEYVGKHRLLLTGTPLQNSLPELWALLNFLLPKVFNSADSFEAWFSKPFATFRGVDQDAERDLTTEEKLLVIRRLHDVLRPFLLRRVKKDVLSQLPAKVERVLRCDLSGWQRAMYRRIQEEGSVLVAEEGGTMAAKGLSNTVMQLRKVCNHPFLFEDSYDINDMLWRSSGKFELLDRILPKLKRSGHRVLIFSQMVLLLDILEDYLRMRGLRFVRFDGHTAAGERERCIAKFNAPDSPYFVFCLSTRAGGLGINLATADTVIIFDSDWNPTADMQAQDRAHRIGQTREVRVYRLVTNSVVEGTMLSRASDKSTMEQLVIGAGSFNKHRGDSKTDRESRSAMLQELLEGDPGAGDDDDGVVQEDEEVNEMLARDEAEFTLFQEMDAERATADAAAGLGDRTRLATEKEAPRHITARIAKPGKAAKAAADTQAQASRGARRRKQVSYDDGLTDRDFDLLLRAGGTQEDLERIQKKARERQAAEKAAGIVKAPKPRVRRRKKGPLTEEEKLKKLSKERRRKLRRTPRARLEVKPELDGPELAARKRLNAFFTPVMRAMAKARAPKEGGGRKLADIFRTKPDPSMYPDYYQIVKRPVSTQFIQGRVNTAFYADRDAFTADFKQMVDNAMLYNSEGSWVHQNAKWLWEAFEKEIVNVPRTVDDLPPAPEEDGGDDGGDGDGDGGDDDDDAASGGDDDGNDDDGDDGDSGSRKRARVEDGGGEDAASANAGGERTIAAASGGAGAGAGSGGDAPMQ